MKWILRLIVVGTAAGAGYAYGTYRTTTQIAAQMETAMAGLGDISQPGSAFFDALGADFSQPVSGPEEGLQLYAERQGMARAAAREEAELREVMVNGERISKAAVDQAIEAANRADQPPE